MGETNKETDQITFFPDLTPAQLDALKNFWNPLINVLYEKESKEENTKDGNHLKQKQQQEEEEEEEIKNIIKSSNNSTVEYCNQLWDWIMMDDPDRMVLKFIKAKKFKSNLDSLKMLMNSLSFRIQKDINQIKSENSSIANQLRIGKAFIFGIDKSGCPIFRINAARHKQNHQTPKELEDFVLYSMELTRLFVVPPAQNVSMLVDLSGFGMSNMDWKCTNFMISTLEAHYPETLNNQVIHNAPWIFQGLWKVISTMVDPVVRSKVLFTSKDEDLLQMIDKKFLFKSQGGESEFKWGIPTNYPIDINATTTTSTTSSNNNKSNTNGNQESQNNNKVQRIQLNLTKEEEKIKLNELDTRQKLIHHFISLTRIWLSLSHSHLPSEESNQTVTHQDDHKKLIRVLKLRDLVKMILRAQYLKLMKYIQPMTIYHYREILNAQEPGIIRWNNSISSNKHLSEQQTVLEANDTTGISIFGVESARPHLLKLINDKLDDLRPEFVVIPLPAELSTAPANTQIDLDLSLNKIFLQISQLEF